MQTDLSTQTARATAPVVVRPAPRARWRLRDRTAFVLLAAVVVTLLAGSSAPTPLYAVYQQEWHFSPVTTTIVFAVYAVALLLALLTAGSLSDHVGRRPVILAAIATQVVTMAVLATAAGVPELVVGRVLQGLSTGAALGAIGAALLDLDTRRGTIANAVSPPVGTAVGALGSGLLVQFVPAPTHLVYVVLLAALLAQAVGVVLMRETSSPAPGAWASLRPEVVVPAAVRRPMLAAVPMLVAVWGLGSLYASLGPSVVADLVGSRSAALGGLSLFTLAAFGATAVVLTRRAAITWVARIGASALAVGAVLTVVALGAGSVVGFFAATAVAGVGFGAGFQGAIRSVVPLAAPHERAGVLSVLFLVSYLALGLPAVVAGFLVVHGGGLLRIAEGYGGVVALLALVALTGQLATTAGRRRRRTTACLG
jgi:MFS family permease